MIFFLVRPCSLPPLNPTAQQFMSAYRKLLLQNEVTSGRGANCLNDITKILEAPTRRRKSEKNIANSAELEMLMNFDFEHTEEDIEFIHTEPYDDKDQLQLHSTAYMASIVEKKVIHQIIQRGSKACLKCIDVFTHNDIVDNSFIAFISTKTNIIPPCQSTLDIVQYIDRSLKKYGSKNFSFESMVTHITKTMDISRFYTSSVFDENHDHYLDFIKHVITVYLDIKSRNASKLLTRLSQKKLIRHEQLKVIHREGQ